MAPYGHIFVIRKTGEDGSCFPLLSRTCRIGRGHACDIRIQREHVMEEHCLIEVGKDSQVRIRNVAENCQTSVNGVALSTDWLELKHLDKIDINDRSFRWEYLNGSKFCSGNQLSVNYSAMPTHEKIGEEKQAQISLKSRKSAQNGEPYLANGGPDLISFDSPLMVSDLKREDRKARRSSTFDAMKVEIMNQGKKIEGTPRGKVDMRKSVVHDEFKLSSEEPQNIEICFNGVKSANSQNVDVSQQGFLGSEGLKFGTGAVESDSISGRNNERRSLRGKSSVISVNLPMVNSSNSSKVVNDVEHKGMEMEKLSELNLLSLKKCSSSNNMNDSMITNANLSNLEARESFLIENTPKSLRKSHLAARSSDQFSIKATAKEPVHGNTNSIPVTLNVPRPSKVTQSLGKLPAGRRKSNVKANKSLCYVEDMTFDSSGKEFKILVVPPSPEQGLGDVEREDKGKTGIDHHSDIVFSLRKKTSPHVNASSRSGRKSKMDQDTANTPSKFCEGSVQVGVKASEINANLSVFANENNNAEISFGNKTLRGNVSLNGSGSDMNMCTSSKKAPRSKKSSVHEEANLLQSSLTGEDGASGEEIGMATDVSDGEWTVTRAEISTRKESLRSNKSLDISNEKERSSFFQRHEPGCKSDVTPMPSEEEYTSWLSEISHRTSLASNNGTNEPMTKTPIPSDEEYASWLSQASRRTSVASISSTNTSPLLQRTQRKSTRRSSASSYVENVRALMKTPLSITINNQSLEKSSNRRTGNISRRSGKEKTLSPTIRKGKRRSTQSIGTPYFVASIYNRLRTPGSKILEGTDEGSNSKGHTTLRKKTNPLTAAQETDSVDVDSLSDLSSKISCMGDVEVDTLMQTSSLLLDQSDLSNAITNLGKESSVKSPWTSTPALRVPSKKNRVSFASPVCGDGLGELLKTPNNSDGEHSGNETLPAAQSSVKQSSSLVTRSRKESMRSTYSFLSSKGGENTPVNSESRSVCEGSIFGSSFNSAQENTLTLADASSMMEEEKSFMSVRSLRSCKSPIEDSATIKHRGKKDNLISSHKTPFTNEDFTVVTGVEDSSVPPKNRSSFLVVLENQSTTSPSTENQNSELKSAKSAPRNRSVVNVESNVFTSLISEASHDSGDHTGESIIAVNGQKWTVTNEDMPSRRGSLRRKISLNKSNQSNQYSVVQGNEGHCPSDITKTPIPSDEEYASWLSQVSRRTSLASISSTNTSPLLQRIQRKSNGTNEPMTKTPIPSDEEYASWLSQASRRTSVASISSTNTSPLLQRTQGKSTRRSSASSYVENVRALMKTPLSITINNQSLEKSSNRRTGNISRRSGKEKTLSPTIRKGKRRSTQSIGTPYFVASIYNRLRTTGSKILEGTDEGSNSKGHITLRKKTNPLTTAQETDSVEVDSLSDLSTNISCIGDGEVDSLKQTSSLLLDQSDLSNAITNLGKEYSVKSPWTSTPALRVSSKKKRVSYGTPVCGDGLGELLKTPNKPEVEHSGNETLPEAQSSVKRRDGLVTRNTKELMKRSTNKTLHNKGNSHCLENSVVSTVEVLTNDESSTYSSTYDETNNSVNNSSVIELNESQMSSRSLRSRKSVADYGPAHAKITSKTVDSNNSTTLNCSKSMEDSEETALVEVTPYNQETVEEKLKNKRSDVLLSESSLHAISHIVTPSARVKSNEEYSITNCAEGMGDSFENQVSGIQSSPSLVSTSWIFTKGGSSEAESQITDLNVQVDLCKKEMKNKISALSESVDVTPQVRRSKRVSVNCPSTPDYSEDISEFTQTPTNVPNGNCGETCFTDKVSDVLNSQTHGSHFLISDKHGIIAPEAMGNNAMSSKTFKYSGREKRKSDPKMYSTPQEASLSNNMIGIKMNATILPISGNVFGDENALEEVDNSVGSEISRKRSNQRKSSMSDSFNITPKIRKTSKKSIDSTPGMMSPKDNTPLVSTSEKFASAMEADNEVESQNGSERSAAIDGSVNRKSRGRKSSVNVSFNVTPQVKTIQTGVNATPDFSESIKGLMKTPAVIPSGTDENEECSVSRDEDYESPASRRVSSLFARSRASTLETSEVVTPASRSSRRSRGNKKNSISTASDSSLRLDDSNDKMNFDGNASMVTATGIHDSTLEKENESQVEDEELSTVVGSGKRKSRGRKSSMNVSFNVTPQVKTIHPGVNAIPDFSESIKGLMKTPAVIPSGTDEDEKSSESRDSDYESPASRRVSSLFARSRASTLETSEVGTPALRSSRRSRGDNMNSTNTASDSSLRLDDSNDQMNFDGNASMVTATGIHDSTLEKENESQVEDEELSTVVGSGRRKSRGRKSSMNVTFNVTPQVKTIQTGVNAIPDFSESIKGLMKTPAVIPSGTEEYEECSVSRDEDYESPASRRVSSLFARSRDSTLETSEVGTPALRSSRRSRGDNMNSTNTASDSLLRLDVSNDIMNFDGNASMVTATGIHDSTLEKENESQVEDEELSTMVGSGKRKSRGRKSSMNVSFNVTPQVKTIHPGVNATPDFSESIKGLMKTPAVIPSGTDEDEKSSESRDSDYESPASRRVSSLFARSRASTLETSEVGTPALRSSRRSRGNKKNSISTASDSSLRLDDSNDKMNFDGNTSMVTATGFHDSTLEKENESQVEDEELSTMVGSGKRKSRGRKSSMNVTFKDTTQVKTIQTGVNATPDFSESIKGLMKTPAVIPSGTDMVEEYESPALRRVSSPSASTGAFEVEECDMMKSASRTSGRSKGGIMNSSDLMPLTPHLLRLSSVSMGSKINNSSVNASQAFTCEAHEIDSQDDPEEIVGKSEVRTRKSRGRKTSVSASFKATPLNRSIRRKSGNATPDYSESIENLMKTPGFSVSGTDEDEKLNESSDNHYQSPASRRVSSLPVSRRTSTKETIDIVTPTSSSYRRSRRDQINATNKADESKLTPVAGSDMLNTEVNTSLMRAIENQTRSGQTENEIESQDDIKELNVNSESGNRKSKSRKSSLSVSFNITPQINTIGRSVNSKTDSTESIKGLMKIPAVIPSGTDDNENSNESRNEDYYSPASMAVSSIPSSRRFSTLEVSNLVLSSSKSLRRSMGKKILSSNSSAKAPLDVSYTLICPKDNTSLVSTTDTFTSAVEVENEVDSQIEDEGITAMVGSGKRKSRGRKSSMNVSFNVTPQVKTIQKSVNATPDFSESIKGLMKTPAVIPSGTDEDEKSSESRDSDYESPASRRVSSLFARSRASLLETSEVGTPISWSSRRSRGDKMNSTNTASDSLLRLDVSNELMNFEGDTSMVTATGIHNRTLEKENESQVEDEELSTMVGSGKRKSRGRKSSVNVSFNVTPQVKTIQTGVNATPDFSESIKGLMKTPAVIPSGTDENEECSVSRDEEYDSPSKRVSLSSTRSRASTLETSEVGTPALRSSRRSRGDNMNSTNTAAENLLRQDEGNDMISQNENTSLVSATQAFTSVLEAENEVVSQEESEVVDVSFEVRLEKSRGRKSSVNTSFKVTPLTEVISRKSVNATPDFSGSIKGLMKTPAVIPSGTDEDEESSESRNDDYQSPMSRSVSLLSARRRPSTMEVSETATSASRRSRGKKMNVSDLVPQTPLVMNESNTSMVSVIQTLASEGEVETEMESQDDPEEHPTSESGKRKSRGRKSSINAPLKATSTVSSTCRKSVNATLTNSESVEDLIKTPTVSVLPISNSNANGKLSFSSSKAFEDDAVDEMLVTERDLEVGLLCEPGRKKPKRRKSSGNYENVEGMKQWLVPKSPASRYSDFVGLKRLFSQSSPHNSYDEVPDLRDIFASPRCSTNVKTQNDMNSLCTVKNYVNASSETISCQPEKIAHPYRNPVVVISKLPIKHLKTSPGNEGSTLPVKTLRSSRRRKLPSKESSWKSPLEAMGIDDDMHHELPSSELSTLDAGKENKSQRQTSSGRKASESVDDKYVPHVSDECVRITDAAAESVILKSNLRNIAVHGETKKHVHFGAPVSEIEVQMEQIDDVEPTVTRKALARKTINRKHTIKEILSCQKLNSNNEEDPQAPQDKGDEANNAVLPRRGNLRKRGVTLPDKDDETNATKRTKTSIIAENLKQSMASERPSRRRQAVPVNEVAGGTGANADKVGDKLRGGSRKKTVSVIEVEMETEVKETATQGRQTRRTRGTERVDEVSEVAGGTGADADKVSDKLRGGSRKKTVSVVEVEMEKEVKETATQGRQTRRTRGTERSDNTWAVDNSKSVEPSSKKSKGKPVSEKDNSEEFNPSTEVTNEEITIRGRRGKRNEDAIVKPKKQVSKKGDEGVEKKENVNTVSNLGKQLEEESAKVERKSKSNEDSVEPKKQEGTADAVQEKKEKNKDNAVKRKKQVEREDEVEENKSEDTVVELSRPEPKENDAKLVEKEKVDKATVKPKKQRGKEEGIAAVRRRKNTEDMAVTIQVPKEEDAKLVEKEKVDEAPVKLKKQRGKEEDIAAVKKGKNTEDTAVTIAHRQTRRGKVIAPLTDNASNDFAKEVENNEGRKSWRNLKNGGEDEEKELNAVVKRTRRTKTGSAEIAENVARNEEGNVKNETKKAEEHNNDVKATSKSGIRKGKLTSRSAELAENVVSCEEGNLKNETKKAEDHSNDVKATSKSGKRKGKLTSSVCESGDKYSPSSLEEKNVQVTSKKQKNSSIEEEKIATTEKPPRFKKKMLRKEESKDSVPETAVQSAINGESIKKSSNAAKGAKRQEEEEENIPRGRHLRNNRNVVSETTDVKETLKPPRKHTPASDLGDETISTNEEKSRATRKRKENSASVPEKTTKRSKVVDNEKGSAVENEAPRRVLRKR